MLDLLLLLLLLGGRNWLLLLLFKFLGNKSSDFREHFLDALLEELSSLAFLLLSELRVSPFALLFGFFSCELLAGVEEENAFLGNILAEGIEVFLASNVDEILVFIEVLHAESFRQVLKAFAGCSEDFLE